MTREYKLKSCYDSVSNPRPPSHTAAPYPFGPLLKRENLFSEKRAEIQSLKKIYPRTLLALPLHSEPGKNGRKNNRKKKQNGKNLIMKLN